MEDLLLVRSLGDQPGVAARKLRTQVSVLRRVVNFVIAVVAIAAIFMSIERLRQLGTGLLASAGIAGLVIGFSAQKTLGNLLAGIQIALAQPIRVGDAVVVEGEWGHVEDITLTYVVLRDLGPAPADPADQLLHREAVPELDGHLRRGDRHASTCTSTTRSRSTACGPS